MEIIKKFKSLYDFGGRCLKIRDVCMDFEPYFKVHNLVSVHPKGIILTQMTNLNIIFHVVVSFYRLVKFETRPSSLMNFGTANVECVTFAVMLLDVHRIKDTGFRIKEIPETNNIHMEDRDVQDQ